VRIFSTYYFKTNPYRRFFSNLAILLAILFLLDFLIGHVLSYYYFRKQRDYNYRTTYAINSTKAALLIFGSSRANHHYRPDIFEKQLYLTCYNVGRDGEFLFYNYAILRAVLKRYSPKMIILDFSPGDFSKNEDSYDRLSILLPYYKSHLEMDSVIELRSPWEKLKLGSYIYPYNSSILNIFSQNAILPPEKKEDINGYLPVTRKLGDSIKVDNTPIEYELDSNIINIYKSFIRDCINSKVKLYVVCSPYFRKSAYTDYAVKLAIEVAKKYNVKFFDYLQDTVFINHANLFYDPAHLNDEGAKLFSIQIADRITSDQN
jgi:hypothetical protein